MTAWSAIPYATPLPVIMACTAYTHNHFERFCRKRHIFETLS
jgi:hypothetical protein